MSISANPVVKVVKCFKSCQNFIQFDTTYKWFNSIKKSLFTVHEITFIKKEAKLAFIELERNQTGY